MTYKRERHFNTEMKMNNHWKLLSIVVVLGALTMTGCNFPVLLSAETPTPITPVVIVTDLPTDEPFDLRQAGARDAALEYIKTTYPSHAPSENLNWKVEEITPEGLVGSSTFRYTAEDWVITLTAPVVAPEAVIYHVEVLSHASSFRWEGEVDANGHVTEISSTGGDVPVMGWFGYVVSTPEGAQFDDYVVIEGVGEFGVEGSDEAIHAEIIALRDKEEAGKYANFWGTLRCDVIDYGGCQLIVTRIRSGIELTDPEPVEGWEGTIIGLTYDEPGAPQPDDAFILEGEYPVQYGIDSYIAENGWPIYREELESRRDTGQTIRVWGDLVCGFPDVNACQIRVRRLEVDGAEVDAYEGWATYINEDYGYQFRYPAEADILETGVMGFPTEELPEGMSIDDYIAQLEEQYGERLCVGLNFSTGYISISPPENESFKYSLCGRTGVGEGEMIDKTEEVFVAGDFYPAEGFEFIGNNETLPEHDETLVIRLPDGTRIEYGSLPLQEVDYQKYSTEVKLVLLEILSTYETIE
jgi:hypothetical protein